jgi:hypothetical protein
VVRTRGAPYVRRTMPIPVHIETLHDPARYSAEQMGRAFAIAAALNRGKMVLVEPPAA